MSRHHRCIPLCINYEELVTLKNGGNFLLSIDKIKKSEYNIIVTEKRRRRNVRVKGIVR